MTVSVRPQLLRPRALRPGDLVVIAALSGPLPAEFEPNIATTVAMFERMGFRVRRAPLLEAGRLVGDYLVEIEAEAVVGG